MRQQHRMPQNVASTLGPRRLLQRKGVAHRIDEIGFCGPLSMGTKRQGVRVAARNHLLSENSRSAFGALKKRALIAVRSTTVLCLLMLSDTVEPGVSCPVFCYLGRGHLDVHGANNVCGPHSSTIRLGSSLPAAVSTKRPKPKAESLFCDSPELPSRVPSPN